MTPGIFSPPELADGLRRLIQPLTIRQQREQFNGAKKLHRVRPRPPQWPQLACGNEQRDIFRCAVQQLRHVPRQEARRQIPRSPGCHRRRLSYVVIHDSPRRRPCPLFASYSSNANRIRNSKARSAAFSGLSSPDFTSFQSIFSSVVFIRAQFFFKPSGGPPALRAGRVQ